ncbi:uncharacterized protein M6G45_013490 [Spheniscus humboldti]
MKDADACKSGVECKPSCTELVRLRTQLTSPSSTLSGPFFLMILVAVLGRIIYQRLPDSKSEFTNHCNNFPSLQRTSASRGLFNVSHEKLQKDNALLDTEVSEFLQEREQINKLEQKHEDLCTDERMYEEEMAKVVFLEEQIKNLRDEQELLCSELLESNKKKEELEKQLKESKEEKRLLLEEIAQLKQDILTTREQGDSTLEETLRMNQGMVHRENRFLALQSSAGSLDGSVKQSLSDERFQQQEEKMQQLRQDLRRVQNLCSSAERELRYEREKNMDLQKQNLLLQQERTKVKAELKQARAKPSNATETCSSLSAQREKSQQKVKELEQKLVKRFQADTPQSSLQEELAQEKSKVCEAQKKGLTRDTSSFESLCSSFQDSKSVNFSKRRLQSKELASPRTSFPSREPPDSLSTLKATRDPKPEGEAESQDSSFCLSPSQPSEIGSTRRLEFVDKLSKVEEGWGDGGDEGNGIGACVEKEGGDLNIRRRKEGRS